MVEIIIAIFPFMTPVLLFRPGWISYDDLIESVEVKAKTSCIQSRGEDIAQLFFTSGTTGKPKMVTHTQASYGIGQKVTTK